MKGKRLGVLPLGAALICLGAAFLAVGCGSGSARFRFVQASTGVPTNVDLQVDGKVVQSAVGFGQTATYRSTSSGSRKFELFAAGTTTNPYVNATVSLGSGDTTVIAENAFTAITLAPYTDNNTAPTTGNTKLRIIHASPTAQAIDIYVVPTGNGIAGFNPQITNFLYPNASSYLSLSAATYDVVMTVSGTQNPINGLTDTYTLTAGQIRTIVVLDNSVGGGPYTQLLLNDLN
jgi:Domain of unknown function (DUF4397)